jgi:hypothetical protein
VRARALALALAAVSLAACGGDDGGGTTDARPRPDGDPTVIDAAPRQVVMENYTLVPGELVEIIMNGDPDDTAALHLSAPVAEMDWNIHGHDDGGTQTVYEELNVMSADYTFIPPHDTDWWLLLRNSGPTDMTIMVTAELYGAITWSPQ